MEGTRFFEVKVYSLIRNERQTASTEVPDAQIEEGDSVNPDTTNKQQTASARVLSAQIEDKDPKSAASSTANIVTGDIATVETANAASSTVETANSASTTKPVIAEVTKPPRNEKFGHEIVHLHRIDGSLPLSLHPEDIRTVIEADCKSSPIPLKTS